MHGPGLQAFSLSERKLGTGDKLISYSIDATLRRQHRAYYFTIFHLKPYIYDTEF